MPDLFFRADALLSPCGSYRYWLTRTWDAILPPLCWLMLNPSTADASADDPTIRRCMDFARRWGYGGIVVVNLFALRATDPRQLKQVADPVGPDNDQHLIDSCVGLHVIAAWGARAPAHRVRHVGLLLQSNALMIDCLGLTGSGAPRHPLYVLSATKPVPYRFAGNHALAST